MMPDWLAKYPGVARLLQQPGDVLEGVTQEEERAIALPEIEVPPTYRGQFRHILRAPACLDYVPPGAPPALLAIVYCETRCPAPICTCGRYRLVWQ